MELVYLWIEEYKNIENQGFNFSPKFEFHYDKDSEKLTKVKDESTTFKSIFPDNINITAIVGENGSGKTSIINSIINLNVGFKKILIYYYKKEIFLINYLNETIPFISKITKNITNIYEQEENSNLTEIYSKYYKKTFITREQKAYANRYLNNIQTSFRNKNIDDIYIINLFKSNLIIPFKKPTYLIINTISDKYGIFNSNIKYYIKKHNYSIDFISNNFWGIRNKESKENSLKLLNFYLIVANIYTYQYQDLSSCFFNIFYDTSPSNFDELLEIFSNYLQKERHLVLNDINYLIDYLDTNFESNKYYDEFTIEIDKLDTNFIKKYQNIIHKVYDSNEQNNNIFSFEFDILFSEGEFDFLNLFSKLQHLFDEKKYNLILLDEIETSFHPNWQKKFIKNITDFLIQNYPNYNFQLITTSHSPFILSDLPKENIIFLKNGKQEKPFKKDEQTFGANIHTLLSHGFFMDGGLMGEFAKSKITEVIELLKKDQLSKDEIKECKHIISIIGEPILQKTLEHQLNEKLNSNETELQKLEREQKEIQEKIDRLKRENNETN